MGILDPFPPSTPSPPRRPWLLTGLVPRPNCVAFIPDTVAGKLRTCELGPVAHAKVEAGEQEAEDEPRDGPVVLRRGRAPEYEMGGW